MQIGEILDISVYHCDRIKQIESFEWKPMDEIHALINECIVIRYPAKSEHTHLHLAR